MRNLKKNILSGLAISLVLAMAIGSFALGEMQTPANTQLETQSAAVNDGTGDFNVSGGVKGTDYDYSSGVLSIHPQSSATQITISTNGETTDCIEITAGPQDAEKAVNIILNGVNINRSNEAEATPKAALKIAENATFNANITLAENSNNTLIGEAGAPQPNQALGSPGIDKSDDGSVGIDQLGKLTIKGTGQLTAEGGFFAAGIGGGFDRTADTGYNGSNITISGGNITATGGQDGAGIGGGVAGNGTGITISGGKVEAYTGDWKGNDNLNGGLGAGIGGGATANGTDITITGGEVIATGKNCGAGIGGGTYGNGSNITISGGSITATGGYVEAGGQKYLGAGIGSGGMTGTASGNKLSGNAVVLAISGEDNSAGGPPITKPFDGFADSDMTGGIAFTGVGEYEFIGSDPSKPGAGNWVLKSTTWNEGEQYGDVTITEDITFPAGLKIDSTEALTIGKNAEGKEATISMAEGKELTVEGSLINEGIIDIPAENLVCGEDNGEITTLLNYDPQGGSIKTNEDNYITYQDATEVKKYENLPEATKEGYDLDGWYTEKEGKGTKIEDSSNVLLNQHILYANWVEPAPPTPPTPTPPGPEPGPEPTPTPEPTPDPSVDPDSGDGSGSGASSKTGDSFAGVAALALLGVATTGAVLVRKRK